MNRALWWKAIVEARLLLAASAVGLFAFFWLYIWLAEMVPLDALAIFLSALPKVFEDMVGVPFAQVATTAGRIGLSYVDPVVLLVTGAWGIARGSDSVSGEIDRGTMEMLLAQPVSRASLLLVHATVTTLGAAVIVAAGWLGLVAGAATVPLEPAVAAKIYLPSSLNLFAFTFFMAGLTTMVSSWDRQRWKTIGLVAAFYLIELVVEMVARAVPKVAWLEYLTFRSAFEPHVIAARAIDDLPGAWTLSLQYSAVLLGLGVLCHAAASVIFSRRDIPAPL